MGCDIHTFVERKENDKWIAVESKNPYYGKWEDEEEFIIEGWVYNSRHYLFFAFLADVRNYGSIEPLSTPKGFPDDLSSDVKKCLEDDCDLHSSSYYSLKELEEADLSQEMIITRMVSSQTAREYRENGTIPTLYCGGTNAENYEQLTWNEPLENEIKGSLNGIIEKMKAVANEYNLANTDVRLVFAFDN